MNINSLRWHIVSSDELPSILLLGPTEKGEGSALLSTKKCEGMSVGVGYLPDQMTSTYKPPSVLVINDNSVTEVLSWLRAFSKEVSPVSQFVRTISVEDWKSFGKGVDQKNVSARLDVWASVVAGEAIAQGDVGTGLENLPLSRAAACFSSTMAHAARLYGFSKATETCVERLHSIEVDERFVKRVIGVRDLYPAWLMVSQHQDGYLSVNDTVNLVISRALPSGEKNTGMLSNVLRLLEGLATDSIEKRVLVFRDIENDLKKFSEKESSKEACAIVLAIATFLVGRGTSHEFLLRRVRSSYPMATVWFGLMAGLCGPNCWDVNWIRAAKGIERQLRQRFYWGEFSGSDLSWLEYSWLAKVSNKVEVFSMLPKLVPKALSIEILPGASCQFRLSSGGSVDATVGKVHSSSEGEKELRIMLSSFVDLASKAKNVLDRSEAYTQKSFEFSDEGIEKGKPNRGGRRPSRE